MRKLFILFSILMSRLLFGQELPEITSYQFAGMINNKYAIKMFLAFDRKTDTIMGSYYYLSTKKPITLNGYQKEKSTFWLDEFSGIFEGKVSVNDQKETVYEGVWKSKDRKKNFIFQLASTKLTLPAAFASAYRADQVDAEFSLTAQKKGTFQAVGNAAWTFEGEDKQTIIHVGEFNATLQIKDGVATYLEPETGTLTFLFFENGVVLFETGSFGGVNVTFQGVYYPGTGS